MKHRIAILCSDDFHHQYLIKKYSELFDVALIVMEPFKFQQRSLLKHRKLVDYCYSKYHTFRRNLLGLTRFRKKYFECAFNFLQYDIKIVNSINNIEVKDYLAQTNPDLTIVICTSILKGEVLAQLKGRAINIHGGYLPDYRGNHCFFFATYNRDYDKIGSTLHFINSGIDTGDIIENVVPNISNSDFPESLYCRAEMKAINRLAEMLLKTKNLSELPRAKQQYRTRLNRTKDRGIIKEVTYYFRRLTKTIQLPNRPND